ncbi:MAG TPA: 2-oxoglutarate and iron-dependent oxygenase domain-containing protein [Rhabdochlamydiaceae bacterium]|nr:2-oxoglutarate and iron-dependent oxygenase domain-containing protein [Rhabdochlamydiaceae bacterium]
MGIHTISCQEWYHLKDYLQMIKKQFAQNSHFTTLAKSIKGGSMLTKMVCAALLLTGLNLNAETSPEQLDIRIPVVDMQDFYNPEKQEHFINTLYGALTEIGFFAVRNTGVDREVIRSAYAQAETFFKKDDEFKAKNFVQESKGQRGFIPGEIAKGHRAKDFKEFYHIGRERPLEELKQLSLHPNVWPDQDVFKEAMTTLYTELEKYVVPLQEAIVMTINRNASMKIAPDTFHQMTKNGDTLLRALYYPALTKEQINKLEQPLFWAAEHTDIDLLAILPFATEKGLQIQLDGQWLNVIVPDDAFIVNAGDMLRNLTNGLVVSARHRVMAQEPNKSRFSMVLFVHPTSSTSLAPFAGCIEQTGGVQKFAPGTRQEFLWERLLELNIAPMLIEPYSKTGHTERQLQYGKESPQVVQLLIDHSLASEELLQALRSR